MDDNPYQAPTFDEAPVNEVEPKFGLGASDLTEAEIRAFVGKKADYYLANWSSVLHHTGRATGFNWAAAFFGVLWIPYRKMYRIAWIVFGILIVEDVVEEVGGNFGFHTTIDSITGIAVGIVCWRYGNAWYLAHTKREVARVRALGLVDDAYYQTLARRGGTSMLASFGLFSLFILVAFAVAAVSELLLPGD